MSDTGEHLDVLQEAKALWLKTHVNYELRSSRTGKSIDRSVDRATSGTEATSERRKVLREKLRQLRGQAVEFSTLALEDDFKAMRDRLDEVDSHIDRQAWDLAEAAVAQAEQRIAEGRRRLKTLLALRDRCDRLPGQIGRIGTEQDLDTVVALVDRVDPIRRLVTPPMLDMERAARDLDQLEEDVITERDRLAERRGRMATLHMERRQLIDDLTVLTQRATEAEGDPGSLIGALTLLVSGLVAKEGARDEGALTLALEHARSEQVRLQKAVEEAEAAKDLRERIKLLETLRQQFEQVTKDCVGVRAAANPVHVEELDGFSRDVAELLEDEDLAKVSEIQSKLADLEGHRDFVIEETARIAKDQQRVRRALTTYQGYLTSKPTSKHWQSLQEAFSALPVAISAGKDPAFSTSRAWAFDPDDEYRAVEDFLRLIIIVSGSEKGIQERKAYTEAEARRKQLKKRLAQLKRHATPTQLTTINDALDDSKQWLDADDIDRLDDTQRDELGEVLDTISDTLDEIEVARGEAKNQAQTKDKEDGGHSIQRHGPDVTDEQLTDRLKSGYAPGGTFSPTRKSCKFINYGEWEATRTAAFGEAERRLGISFGPLRDQNGGGGPITFTMPHGRVVGEGFEGVGAGTYKAHPKGGGGGQVYSAFAPLPPLTQTKSTIEWDGKHWVASQHFPTN